MFRIYFQEVLFVISRNAEKALPTKKLEVRLGTWRWKKKTQEDLGAAVGGKGSLEELLGSCTLQAHKL